MARDVQSVLLEELSQLLGPLIAAAESDTMRRLLFQRIGWDLENSPGFPLAQFTG